MIRFALVVCLAACGARSQLDGPGASGATSHPSNASSGSGAAGGSSGAGGSGSTSSGGSGGSSAAACVKLVQTGGAVTVPTLAGADADVPRLHPLPDGRMAIVHRTYNAGKIRVVAVAAAWTAGWPPIFAAPVVLHDTSGISYAVDRTLAPQIAMLASPTPVGSGMAFALVDPAKGGFVPLVAIDATAERTPFVLDGPDRYFVASDSPGAFGGEAYQLRIGWVIPTSNVGFHGPIDAGCLDHHVVADGVRTATGWLLARSGTSQTTCPAGPAPSGQNVLVTHYSVTGMQASDGAIYPLPAPIGQLALVPRGGGAWLVHWQAGPSLAAFALDDGGKIASGPHALATIASPPFAFAAERLDDGLVVGFMNDPADNPPDLDLVVADAAGKPIASAVLADQLPIGAPQLAFDAASRQVLVAISQTNAAGAPEIHLARFSCE